MKTTGQILFLFFLAASLLCCNNEPGEEEKFCFDCFDFACTDLEPAWSPDGQWIAYSHMIDIYLVHPDGTCVTLWHEGGGMPAWSPDWQWIAFSQYAQIWKKKLNGYSLTQLTFEGRNFFPAWSPDGSLIAYRRSYSWPEDISVMGLWVLDIEGNMKNQYYKGNSGSPIWFDNMNTIYVQGVVDKAGTTQGFNFNLINIETQYYHNIVFVPQATNVQYYSYSNINSKIIFTSQPITGDGHPDTWIMNADGSGRREIIERGYSAAWNPDGTQIVYTDSRGDNGWLWIMDVATGNKRQLTFEHLY